MRKFLLSALLLVLFSFTSFAQISNGGFESWTAANPDGWVGTKTATSGLTITKVATGAYEGFNACGLTNITTTHKRFSTISTTVTNGTVYTMTFWVKGTGQVRTGMFTGINAGTSGYLAYNAYATATADWTQVSQTLTADGNVSVAEFIISVGPSSDILIDDVQVSSGSVTPEANIVSFSLVEQTSSAVIDINTQTINIQVTNGTNLTALTPTITLSSGAMISPLSGVSQDFSTSVIYTVTASDFITVKYWTITVTEAPLSNTVSIYDIQYTTDISGNSPYSGQTISTTGTVTAVVSGQGYYIQEAESAWSGIYVYSNLNIPLVGDNITISATVSEYNNLTELTAVTSFVTNSSGNVVNPISLSFISANTEQYESVLVSVTNAQCTALADAFGVWSVNDGTTTGKVDDIMFVATTTVGNIYDITGIVYERLLDFRILPRTSADVVAQALSSEAEIIDFSFAEQTGIATINSIAGTISIEVATGTNVSALTPTIGISSGAIINPISGIAQDYTNPVVYTVTAQDGIIFKYWTISVTVAPAPTANILTNGGFEAWSNVNPDAWVGAKTAASVELTITKITTAVYGGLNSCGLTNNITTAHKRFSTTAMSVVNGATYEVSFWVKGTGQIRTSMYTGNPATAGTTGGYLPYNAYVSATADWTQVTQTLVADYTTSSAEFIFSLAASSDLVLDDVIILGTLSAEKDITSFTLPQQTGVATIDAVAGTVNIEVLAGTSLTALTPTIVISNNATISPVSGTAQNFTSPVNYTVTAQDGTTKTWTVTVTVAQTLSTEADITAFTLAEQYSIATIDATAKTVNIKVVTGTSLTSLIPTITISNGATISPASGVAQNFTNPVNYTVTAQDGVTKKIFTVTVIVNQATTIYDIQYSTATPADSPLKGQTVTLSGVTVTAAGTSGYYIQDAVGAWNGVFVYDGVNKPAVGDKVTLTALVAEYNGLTELTTITGFSINSSGNTVLSETVTTFNANTEAYEGVLVKILNAPCTATNVSGTWSINDGTGELKVFKTLYDYTTAILATSYDVTGVMTYYSGGLIFEILPRTISDVVVSSTLSSEKEILTFTLPQQTGAASINSVAGTISIEVASGTSVTALIPTITISNNATISPNSGSTQNFTSPVNYTVTAEDGTTKLWTVSVTVLSTLSSEANITAFSFTEQTSGAVINTSTNTIDIIVFAGTNVTSLIPTITISANATVNPATDIARDFSSPVVYTVTAEDGSKKYWIVNVTVSTVLSSLADIKTFEIPNENYVISKTINNSATTVEISVLSSLNVTNIIPTIIVSDGATISPASGVAKNFTYPVVYTVTAADGSKKYWVVSFAKNTNKSIYEIQYTTNISGDSPLKDQQVSTIGTVTAKLSSGYFIQDAEAAWSGIFVSDVVNNPNVGDKIEIFGTISENNVQTVISPLNEVLISTANVVNSIALANVNAANAEQYESILVSVDYAKCTEIFYGSGNWIANDGTDSLLVTTDLYLSSPQLNNHYDLTGIIGESLPQFTIIPRNAGDVIHTLSIENENISNVQLFPNPVKNELFIQKTQNLIEIEILNVLGQSILKQKSTQLNNRIKFEDYKNGVYFVNLKYNNNTVQQFKIVKE